MSLRGLLCAATVLSAVLAVSAEIGMAGFGTEGKSHDIPGTSAVNSDVKYIKCEVCNHVAKQAYRQVKAAEKELKPGKKLSEFRIIELLEKVTDPDEDEGEWISFLDLVESDDGRLLVKEMDFQGKCGRECKTIKRAAEQVTEGIDTDMAELLWKGEHSRSQFTNWLCHETTNSCKQKPPKLPEDRPKGEEFEKADPEAAKMQKMMAKMKEFGMGGQVFSREQATKMADGGEPEEYDEYQDDSNVKPDAGEDEGDEELDGEGGSEAAASGESAPESLLEQASTSAQKVVDKAVERAKDGWESAKNLVNKAQDLLGGEATPETPPSTEAEL